MRREYLAIGAMGAALAGSQLLAIAISPLFRLSAPPNPQDPVNALVYIGLILIFTAVILIFVRFRKRNLARYLILASVFVTLWFVLFYLAFYALAGLVPDPFYGPIGEAIAATLAILAAALLVFALVRRPEWYVVDSIGLTIAVGVTAIMGVSFGLLPAILLLIGLAAYDAWAVYRTKHMVSLADEMTSQRLPVLLVIPKHADYSFREQKSLREQVASGEEREAMFIGLGDLIIPGVLSVSAFTFLDNPVVALGTVIGSLLGFAVLMRFVLGGNPQAGLPLLNGGALAGFALSYFVIYGATTVGLF